MTHPVSNEEYGRLLRIRMAGFRVLNLIKDVERSDRPHEVQRAQIDAIIHPNDRDPAGLAPKVIAEAKELRSRLDRLWAEQNEKGTFKQFGDGGRRADKKRNGA